MRIENASLVLKNKNGIEVHVHIGDIRLCGKYFNEENLHPGSIFGNRFTFYIELPLLLAKDTGLVWQYKDKKKGTCLLLIAPSQSESITKYCWEYIRNYWILKNKGMECFVDFLKSENKDQHKHGYNSTEATEALNNLCDKIRAK